MTKTQTVQLCQWAANDRILRTNFNADNAAIDAAFAADRGRLNSLESTVNPAGADYAEFFEWSDGNPNTEDRRGLLVTLDGEKIRPAGPDDPFILGIVSAVPTVTGAANPDYWRGKYQTDIFGVIQWEDKDLEEIQDEDGTVIQEAKTIQVRKLSPDFDEEQTYIPRSQRPEWDAVGMMGKLVAVDDGSCQVNGWCKPAAGGVATASAERTRFRIMARLDETHIRVLIL